MLPMSSSNSHSHIEPSWKTYYDAKKLLRQTEQRLKDAREYYPHVHLNNNNHYENNDLSNLSSTSYLHHNDTSLIHAGNRSMLNDERTNNKHQLLDSEALLTIRRKISKQKIAAERRAEQLFHSQSDAGHMFETYRPHSTYSTSASLQNLHYSPHRQQRLSPPKPQPPIAYSSHLSQSQSFPSELDTVLQHSTSARILHRENDFERQSFHQPTTRKSIRTMPRENYSLSNGRTTQQRSASASNSGTTKYQDISSSHFLTANDGPRLKHVRRVESAHVSSSSAVKNSLITPDSWRTDPIITKKSSSTSQQEKSSKKKTSNEILIKRTKTDIEETLGQNNQRTEKIIKPKRDTSASKTSVLTTEKTPSKPKSDDDKRKLQDYIQQKRQHEEMFSNEKRLKDEQERIRRDKLKKFNEQIKETSHQHLPSSVTKRTSTFTPTTPKELTEQTRQRLLRVLGPAIDYHINSPLEQPSFLERSSSSSSSSNESVIEVPPVRSNDHSNMRSRSEPPAQNGTTSKNAQRHENLLRWAVDLTRDCDVVENRFKYLRPDRILPFGTIPASYKHLQQDDGNIRNQTSHYDTNHSETNKSSNISRLSRGLNSNRLNDYSNHQVSNDLSSDRRIHRDRAAAKIQAAYRGYTVRKSLPWLNDKPNHYLENASININIHLTKNNYPVDSTLLRYYENQPINDYQQQSIKKASILPLYSDDYDNVPNSLSSNLSTPINHIRRPPSTASSTSTTPIPSPEPQVPSQNERRRSISPPLPPQMSPDNGRPLHQLIQPIFQRINDENLEQTDSMSRVQNLSNNTLPQQPIAKSPIRPPLLSSSTSTNQKRRSLSPQPPQQQLIPNTHLRHRTALTSSPPTSSSESILTAREKRVRQKFNSDIELQAYEKRLKDIEKKIRQLVKRAFEIFDENRSVSSPPTVARTVKPDIRTKPSNLSQDELSINEETSIHQKDTELIKKDNDTSSSSNQQRQSDVVTSDASDLECRVRAYREQLKAKKLELERLKQRKNKEILRRQEDELKKQIESYDHEIQTLRLQPVQQEQTVPVPSSSSSSSIQRSKSNEKKNLSHNNEDKEVDLRLLQTPRDERDTQHDALSIPIDLKQDYDSRRTSIESTKAPLDLNTNLPGSSKEEEESVSSSSLSSSSKSSEKPIKLPSPQISKSPSPSPSPSESSQTTSSSKQERSKSPSPPPPLTSSEPIKSISVVTENRAKSPTSPAPSESSTSSYSSVPDRIKSPTPPPTSSQPIQSTQERIKSPSPPLSQSIKSTSSLIQERIKSPSLSESSSSSLDKYIKPSGPTEPVRSTSSSESSFSSLDKNIKSSVPPEPIQSTASVQERIKSPSSSSSSESSSSSVDKNIKPSEPSEPIKSTSSSIQERIKSPSSSESSSSSIDKHFKSPVPPQPIQSTSSVQERIKSLSLSSSESTSVSIQNHIKSPSPAAPSERIQSISSSTQPHVKSPSPPVLESIKSPSIHEQTPIPIIQRKRSHTSSTNNDYDEDFSETSHSQIETSGKIKIDDIDIESIEEDIDVKHSTHDTNHSSTSKSSGDEQSEILVLVKKSANNTPREPDQSNLPNEIFPSSPRLQKIETDDTSHDISEVDDGNQYIEQQKKADILTETLIKVFIEEAIQQGKEIVYRKSQNSFTKEVSEWLSDEDLTDEENNNKQIPNNHDEDVDNVIQTLAIQQEFLEQLDAAANGNHENDELNLDLSHLEDKNPDGSQVDNTARLAIDIPIKPVVPHTCEQVSQLCHEALTILYNHNTDFSDRSSIDRAIPASYFAIDFSSNQNEETENDDIQRSRHAYNQMIFDLCVELLHEMYSPNIRLTKYPEWQKTKLISKRFYRSNKPKTRDEAENFIEKKIFEILNLIPRQIVYSKWRMLIDRRHGHEQFEMVLDEELRRTENSWIDYDDDCIRIKFDISEHIFEQLIQETLVDCIDVINKKLSLSSNSTRL